MPLPAVGLALVTVTAISWILPPMKAGMALRIGVAAAAIVWLPGWLIASRLPLAPAANTLERLALAFALGCSIICLESLPAYALRLPKAGLLLFHMVVIIVLLGGAVARGAHPSQADSQQSADARSRAISLLTLGGVLTLLLASGFLASMSGPLLVGDGWFHLANITKLIQPPAISPDCSFFKGVGSDPRYPWSGFHLVGALVATAARAEAMPLYVQLPRVLPLVALCALAFLMRRTLASDPIMWGVLVILLLAVPITVRSFGYIVKHPYPRFFMAYGIAPVYIGLIGEYTRSRNRLLLCCIALSAFCAASFHTMGILNLSLLALVVTLLALLTPVSRSALTAYVYAAAATGVAVGIRAAILLANYPHSAVAGSITDEAVRPLADGLLIVYPQGLLRPQVVVATLACCLLIPFAARRPGILLLGASVLLFPLVSLNPPVATLLAPLVTPSLLRRLSQWPHWHVYAPLLLISVPVGLASIWERYLWPRWRALSDEPALRGKRAHRSRRARSARRNATVAVVVFGVAAAAASCLWSALLWELVTARLRPTSSFMWAAVAFLLLCGLALRLTRWRPELALEGAPQRMPGMFLLLLVAVASLSMTWSARRQLLGGNADSEAVSAKDVSPWLRWKYPLWELDEISMIPTFMKPLEELPSRSSVVYSPFTWCETSVAAFTGQYVLLGRSPGNPRADLAQREAAAKALRVLLRANTPDRQLMETLARHEVDYVVCPPVAKRFCGALDEYPELFAVVDRTLNSALYRVNTDAAALAAARRRPDPWRLPPRAKGSPAPVARCDGLGLLGVHLDREEYEAGGVGRITFEWECVAPMGRDYRIVCHMDSPGAPRINVDHRPLQGQASTTELEPGTIFRESYTFLIPQEASGARYSVNVALWERETGYHPPVSDTSLPIQEGYMLSVADFAVTEPLPRPTPIP